MKDSTLDKLAKYHNEWLKMVYAMGGDAYAEDIVQEMYLKLHNGNGNPLNDSGDVNKFYVWKTLYSILTDYFRQKQKVIKVGEDTLLEQPETNTEDQELAYHELINKVNEEIDTWNWFDKKLFNIYRFSGKSMRKLSEETGISWVSIFHVLKHCKTKLKDELETEYEKYKKL